MGYPPRLTNVNIIFVGRLDDNKNLLSVLRLFPKFADKIKQFTIIGAGPNTLAVQEIALKYPNIRYLGTQSNEMTKRLISRHDLLILPSHYDGWGAVINEALSVGTRVICSRNCGGEVLLDGTLRGASFDLSNMADVIDQWIGKGHLPLSQRAEICTWASTHISGTVAAQYFVNTFRRSDAKAPWLV